MLDTRESGTLTIGEYPNAEYFWRGNLTGVVVMRNWTLCFSKADQSPEERGIVETRSY